LVSCSGREASELAGTYEAQLGFGTVQLSLSPNGEYNETVQLKAQEVVRSTGKWKYDHTHHRVSLENYRQVDNGVGEPLPSATIGTASLPVERTFTGHIRLGPDEGNPFIKKD
jgi:hypothetical protein